MDVASAKLLGWHPADLAAPLPTPQPMPQLRNRVEILKLIQKLGGDLRGNEQASEQQVYQRLHTYASLAEAISSTQKLLDFAKKFTPQLLPTEGNGVIANHGELE